MTAAISDGELGERLAARTLELVDIPSESRAEGALAAHVAELLRAGGAPAASRSSRCPEGASIATTAWPSPKPCTVRATSSTVPGS